MLIADDKVIKRTSVHIVCKDWFIAARQHPTKIQELEKKSWAKEGYLGVSKETLIKNNIDTSKGFQLNYYNSKEFNVDGDNFIYSSSFKMDFLSSIKCPNLIIMIQGENDYFRLNFSNTGCESNLSLEFSELYYNGIIKDLSRFGTDIYNWQNLVVNVVNKNLVISLNGDKIFECAYRESIGNIKSINYYFTGLGAVDNVELKNSKGELRFYDNF